MMYKPEDLSYKTLGVRTAAVGSATEPDFLPQICNRLAHVEATLLSRYVVLKSWDNRCMSALFPCKR